MSCPYCGSRKVLEEYTVKTFDLPNEIVAINHVLCAKCGECYSKTIRDNLATGKRRVVVSRTSYLSGNMPVRSPNKRPLMMRILGRCRR